MCEQLVQSCTRQCSGWDLNSRPFSRKSNALTIAPPSHKCPGLQLTTVRVFYNSVDVVQITLRRCDCLNFAGVHGHLDRHRFASSRVDVRSVSLVDDAEGDGVVEWDLLVCPRIQYTFTHTAIPLTKAGHWSFPKCGTISMLASFAEMVQAPGEGGFGRGLSVGRLSPPYRCVSPGVSPPPAEKNMKL